MSKRFSGFALAFCVSAAVLTGTAAPAAAQTFAKVTDPANPVVTSAGNSFTYGGASWVDADNDGDLDLFVTTVGIFRNDGAGAFVYVPGALATPNQFGNTWADVDNDGDLDVYLTAGFTTGSSLYLNQGGFVFSKVTTGPIAANLANRGWGCAFADYDVDGHVDLFVAAPFGFAGTTNPCRLFRNQGGGVFAQVEGTPLTQDFGPFTVPSWSDHDQDGDPDLFIGTGPANGTVALDYLFRNRRETAPGLFERITTAPLGTDLQDGQVYNWVDYDNDGDLDVYLTNYIGTLGAMPNRLYRNMSGTFVAQTGAQAGAIVTDPLASLASVWQDFDNDGDLDCVVTNDGAAINRYYRNNGNATFSPVTVANLSTAGPHYGATGGDYDGDGRVDLFITGTTTTFALLRNTTANSNHWLKVRLTGTVSNRAAIGARVRVRAVIGGVPVWQMREISAQNSFNSMNALEAHFGLGAATVCDSVVVEWPSGLRMVQTGVPADAPLLIVEDSSTPVAASFSRSSFADGRVALEWWVPGLDGVELEVERAGDGGSWNAIGRSTVSGGGHFRFEDSGAQSGSRYGYRLSQSSGGATETFGEVWIEVPAALRFGIHGVSPNPGRAPFRVEFALTSREAASLELVDVSGRRVAGAAIANPVPGSHRLELSARGSLAHGVYFVRLSQGARHDVRRVVILE